VTDARELWLRAQERKRAITSLGLACAGAALLFVAALVLDLLTVRDYGDFSGPVTVRLGSPEAPDRPAPGRTEPDAALTEPVTAEPAEPQPQVSRPEPVPEDGTAAPQPAPAKPSEPRETVQAPTKPAFAVQKGSESGNAYELSFDAADGQVGRTFGPPIWLYMPLPYTVPDVVYRDIPDYQGIAGTAAQRKEAFATLYSRQADGSWKLKGGSSPDYQERPEIWAMLEEAGYDVANADYKDGKSLRPVVILFRVSPLSRSGEVVLEDVFIESSSGYSDIDKAVRYGFTQGQFRNSGAVPINGRFTYRF